MKRLIYNENELKEEEMNEFVTRVKAFIINDKNEILFANSNNGVQLIGGHVEDGENYEDTLKREIREETGILIDEIEIKEPFFEFEHYIKNHRDTGKNRISKIVYYLIRTNKTPNINDTNYTTSEKNNNFTWQYISIDEFEEYVKTFLNNKEDINRSIAKEILVAFNELKNITSTI